MSDTSGTPPQGTTPPPNVAPDHFGRPTMYDEPRRGHFLMLSETLWTAIGQVAGAGKRNEFIELQLRALPQIAPLLPRAGVGAGDEEEEEEEGLP